MRNSEVEKHYTEMEERFSKYLSEKGYAKDKYKIRAVGYLSLEETFEKGEVPSGFLPKLEEIWRVGPILGSAGHHTCELCSNATSSSEKILVDEENKVKYIFPRMIFHYIEVHKFKPSDEFIAFILKFDILRYGTSF